MKESDIQLKIIKKLQAAGIYVWRNNTTGLYDAKLRGYRSNPYQLKGVGDILGVLPDGRHLEVEVKTAKGKQSPDQAIHAKRVTGLGGVYILARGVEDVDNLLDFIRTKGVQ